MKNYYPPNSDCWNGRKSEEDAYWFGNISFEDLSMSNVERNSSISILGYACDEGVRRNQGRVGAVNGPNEIRKSVAKIAWHLNDNKVYDCGNVNCLNGDMEESQDSLAICVDQILSAGSFPIVLGGGHDVAYGHYNGIRSFLNRNDRQGIIGVINFDAHLDLRKVIDIGNSGTPFYQIAQDATARGKQLHYLPIGIQIEANTARHFNTAIELGVDYIAIDDLSESYYSKIDSFIKSCDVLYITIDMDVFSSAYAPGVSAQSPMGSSPKMILSIFKHIMASRKVVSMDIAEMNPLYDRDGLTAKLASRIVSNTAESYFNLYDKI
ncbi:MAG: formiminoglutamase [Saprospiraceae bacterium]|jgi:formiminoglutamase